MQNLSEKLNNLINLLIFQESFENKEKFLIEDDRKWLEFIRFLNQVKSLRKIQTDVNTANQSLNHKNQILADKETSQNNINIFKMNNTQKLRGEVLNKELSLYDVLNKKFETEVNIFQNLVHNELIKNHLEIGNIPKLESAKVVNFQKIPGDILEIVKDMVLEIQPHGEKKALIKIEPPEMGFLDLEIKVKNKEVKIIAKIERIELLQEIKQNLHNIKTSLEESGLNLKDVQLLLSSGFDNGNMVKNFEKEERNYSEYKTKTERIEEIDNKDIKIEDLNKFYNRNGKYYYIV